MLLRDTTQQEAEHLSFLIHIIFSSIRNFPLAWHTSGEFFVVGKDKG